MTRTLILTLFILSFHNLKAQSTEHDKLHKNDSLRNIDRAINLKIDSLKKMGVDTFLIYYVKCIGGIAKGLKGKCIILPPKYLWWIQNNSTNIQRFDNCYKYPTITNDRIRAFSYYLNNRNQINKEEIKLAEFKKTDTITRDSIKYIAIKEKWGRIDHTCHDMFKFIIDTTIITKDCDEYDLYAKEFDEGYPNLSWKYNQGTKLKILIEIMNKEMIELEKVFIKSQQ